MRKGRASTPWPRRTSWRCAAGRTWPPPPTRTGRRRCPGRGRRSRGTAADHPGRSGRPRRRPREPVRPRGRVRRSPRGLACNNGKRPKLVLPSRDTGWRDTLREYSMPALAQIPATANLADVVFRRAAEQPQAVVLRRPAGASGVSGAWSDVTASQFKDEVVAVAKGLVAAGIKAGDRVALMSHTRYEWTLIDYAIWTAGAVTVPVYETSSAEQTEWILSDSGASACFAETAAFEEMIGGLRDRLPGLAQVWRIDPGSSGSALDALRAAGAEVGDEVITERSAAAKAADLATVIYTSGTTGRPKGC